MPLSLSSGVPVRSTLKILFPALARLPAVYRHTLLAPEGGFGDEGLASDAI